MKEWEERAIDIIAEAKNRVNESPNDYPLGWEESAIFNLQAEMKDDNIFAEDTMDEHRISMAEQIIKNVQGEL